MPNDKTKILIVEDDIFLQDGLEDLLQRENYYVHISNNTQDAYDALRSDSIDLIILDVGLPDGNGYDFCSRIRAEGIDIPVIFLTARDEEYEIVRGLDTGGDDYLTKPFKSMELLSRINALIRRYNKTHEQNIQTIADGMQIDFSRQRVKLDGEELNLTPTEFTILRVLVSNANKLVPREQLLEEIWDFDEAFISDNTLNVHISRLRQKLGKANLQTVRGAGYIWQV